MTHASRGVRSHHQSHLNRTPRWRHGDFATSTAVTLLRVVVRGRVAAPQARVQGTQAGGWPSRMEGSWPRPSRPRLP